MQEQLNRVRWAHFVRQVKGAQVHEISVSRLDKRDKVVLRYLAKARKGHGQAQGEWVVARGEGGDDALTAGVREFLEVARKEFVVRRGAGLDGDAFADASAEGAAAPPAG